MLQEVSGHNNKQPLFCPKLYKFETSVINWSGVAHFRYLACPNTRRDSKTARVRACSGRGEEDGLFPEAAG